MSARQLQGDVPATRRRWNAVELDEHVHQPAVLHRPRHARLSPSFVGLDEQGGAPGKAVEIGNPTVAPLARRRPVRAPSPLFTALRGTIPNNLWWVVTVMFLADRRWAWPIAVLADRREAREGRQVADLHAAGHLARRRLGDLALHVRRPRRQRQEQTGAAERRSGSASAGSAPAAGSRRSSSVRCSPPLAARPARASSAGRWSSGSWGTVAICRRSRPSSSAGSSSATRSRRGIGGFRRHATDGETTSPRPRRLHPGVAVQQRVADGDPDLDADRVRHGHPLGRHQGRARRVSSRRRKIDGATTSQIFWRVTCRRSPPTIGVVVTTLIVHRDEGLRHRQGDDERQLRHPGAGQRHVPAGVPVQQLRARGGAGRSSSSSRCCRS